MQTTGPLNQFLLLLERALSFLLRSALLLTLNTAHYPDIFIWWKICVRETLLPSFASLSSLLLSFIKETFVGCLKFIAVIRYWCGSRFGLRALICCKTNTINPVGMLKKLRLGRIARDILPAGMRPPARHALQFFLKNPVVFLQLGCIVGDAP